MSFQVQPAPRITKAPMKNSTMIQRQLAETSRGDAGGQRRRPPARHQQQPGADRPVETGKPQIGPRPGRRARIDPVAGCVGNAGGRVAHRVGSSRENVAVQRIEGAAALLDGVASGSAAEEPSTSLRLGPAGPRVAACCATLQTFCCIFSVFLWPFLSWSAICGGIPHFAELVST